MTLFAHTPNPFEQISTMAKSCPDHPQTAILFHFGHVVILAVAQEKRNENERHFCSKICPQSCKETTKKEQISFGQVCSSKKKIFQKMQNFGYYSNTLEEWRQASRIRTTTTNDDDKRRVTFQILMLARRRHGPFHYATSSVGLWMHVATWCRFSLKIRGFYWTLESQESQ